MAEIDPRWAWEPYKPSSQSPWDIRKVGHLARRAGFGATWEELEAGLKAGPEKAIDQLLQGDPGQDRLPVLEIEGAIVNAFDDVGKIGKRKPGLSHNINLQKRHATALEIRSA